jgi:flagellar motor component MotA
MFAILGILVVFGAVVGGYLMEKGNLLVPVQPAELIIIAGAAAGTVLMANPPRVLSAILTGIIGAFTGSRYNKAWQLDSLKLLYEFFDQARRGRLACLQHGQEPGRRTWLPPDAACGLVGLHEGHPPAAGSRSRTPLVSDVRTSHVRRGRK